MPEHKLQIPGADGLAEGYVYTPSEGTGQWPGVVFLTDILGVREANQQMAKRVAEQGFVVVLPNIFYRTDKLPVIDFEVDWTNPKTRERIMQLKDGLNTDQMRRDGKTYTEYLLSRPEVKKGRVGVVGYCFTGQMALRMAAFTPDQIGAAASFHGGGLVTDQPDSPHKDIPKVSTPGHKPSLNFPILDQVKGELYFGHADNDRGMTLDNIADLDKALAEWGGKYESELYHGAKHGWTVPSHGPETYHHELAEKAFTKLIDLFKRNLP